MIREIELRGLIKGKKLYSTIMSNFLKVADSFKNADKTSYFFVNKDHILKVIYENNSDTTHIILKTGDETINILNEYSLEINNSNINDAINLFKNLGYNEINKVTQTRTDFIFGNIQASLKYTKDWKYHFEIEHTDQTKSDKDRILDLQAFAQKYSLVILTPLEVSKIITKINNKHNFKNG